MLLIIGQAGLLLPHELAHLKQRVGEQMKQAEIDLLDKRIYTWYGTEKIFEWGCLNIQGDLEDILIR